MYKRTELFPLTIDLRSGILCGFIMEIWSKRCSKKLDADEHRTWVDRGKRYLILLVQPLFV